MPSLLRPASRVAGRRIAPWLMAADIAREANHHWTEQLTPAQRSRLVTLLRQSGGRPANLTPKQRQELRKLVGQLDLPRLARHAAGAASGFRKPGRRGKKR